MLNGDEIAIINGFIQKSLAVHQNRSILTSAKEAVIMSKALRRELDLGELTGQSAYEREIVYWQEQLYKYINYYERTVGSSVFTILEHGTDSDRKKINRSYPTAVFVWNKYLEHVQGMDKEAKK